MKAELELRKVSTGGVMEKEELARLLADARASGKADPSLVDEFTKATLEKDFAGETGGPQVLADEVAEAVAADGGLPGGMSPERLMELTNNPEVMTMLRNPKLQDLMKEMMANGPEDAAAAAQDEETREMLKKLQSILGS